MTIGVNGLLRVTYSTPTASKTKAVTVNMKVHYSTLQQGEISTIQMNCERKSQ